MNLSTILLIIFLTLKLAGVITWPWLWVLSPIWLPIAFLMAVLGIGLTLAVIVFMIRQTFEAFTD